jgi:tetratricopeptide (TPR) repeat protein
MSRHDDRGPAVIVRTCKILAPKRRFRSAFDRLNGSRRTAIPPLGLIGRSSRRGIAGEHCPGSTALFVFAPSAALRWTVSGGRTTRAGRTRSDKGEDARAVQDYGEAIRLNPAFEAVWNGRCWTRAKSANLQAALAHCNEALRLKPDVAATLDSRGLTYLKIGHRTQPSTVGELALWTWICQAQERQTQPAEMPM